MKNPVILIYYKYTALKRAKDNMVQQRAICLALGLRGRILIAQEGINGTLEGEETSVNQYCHYMENHPEFSGIRFKRSPGTGTAFPKLVVKVRREIVTAELGKDDVNPNSLSGKYITPEELHEWFNGKKDFRIIDMRNDYEQTVGQFDNSVMSGMENFRDLKKSAQNLEHLKDETIVTVCTSGVRCEKASGYLLSKGYKDVYQLEDGIAGYMEKFPNQNFKGKLYVFDNRIMMGFDTSSPEHVVLGRCALCNDPSENYTNCAYDECHKHFICCESCLINGLPFCKPVCQEKLKQNHDFKLQVAV
jgi:UPF0176 protein